MEEESKFKDADTLSASTVSPEIANELGAKLDSDKLQLECTQEAEASSLDAQYVDGRDPASEQQDHADFHKAKENKAYFEILSKLAELHHKEKYHTGRTRLRDELRCIVEFMDNDMKDIYSVQKEIDNGTKTTICFDYLWQLFKPGDIVIQVREQKRAYTVLHVTGGRALQKSAQRFLGRDRNHTHQEVLEKEAYLTKYPKSTPFVLDCFYLDFDGSSFGPMPQKFMIKEYDGEKPIKSLEVFPVKFDDCPKEAENALIERGKRFVKLARGDHKFYSGSTIKESPAFENQDEVHCSDSLRTRKAWLTVVILRSIAR